MRIYQLSCIFVIAPLLSSFGYVNIVGSVNMLKLTASGRFALCQCLRGLEIQCTVISSDCLISETDPSSEANDRPEEVG